MSRAEPYLLSGIAFCDYCGNKMMGVTRRQQWRKKDGERVRNTYRYYQCQSRNNQSVCGYHTWRESELEETVVAQIRSAVENKALGSHGQDSMMSKASEALNEVHKEELRNAERRFVQAMKKTASGAADTDLLQEAVSDLDKARARADNTVPAPDARASVCDLGLSWVRTEARFPAGPRIPCRGQRPGCAGRSVTGEAAWPWH